MSSEPFGATMKSLHWLIVISLGSTCGCSALDASKTKSLWSAAGEQPQQPSSIVAIWSEGVVHQAGAPPTRGYAGRVIFYGAEETKPVKVEGTLSVYAFDEVGRGKSDSKPDRKYVFTPEQLARRYDPVKVGPAYAVWIPWDEAGGPRKDISLIVRFVPSKGQLVVGEMARLVLNGTGPSLEAPNTAYGLNRTGQSDPMVRPVSYETPVGGPPSTQLGAERREGTVRSTTIQLPADMMRRLQQPRTDLQSIQQGRRTDYQSVPQAGRTDWQSVPQQTASAAGALPTSPGASSPAPGLSLSSPRWAPPGARSPLGRSRVPGVPIAPLTRDHGTSPPNHAAPPYRPEPTPPAAPPQVDASIWPDAAIPRN